jgi:hypothetical protein
MRVISLKSNKKLVKGKEYIADYFNNTNTGNIWTRNIINIRGFGRYLCKNFTDIDGKELTNILYINPNKSIYNENIDRKPPKKNDIIVCVADSYKYIIKDGKYRVVETRRENRDIKLEGHNRWIKWNSYTFRKLSVQETRELALSQIFDKPENFSVDFIRKFDQEKNKIKILLEAISKSIIDPYRVLNELSVIDWCIHKEQYQKLSIEDFESILDKPLSEILKLYEESLKSN